MTAALYAARAGKKALIIEKEFPGGQIVNSPLVENYPALPNVSGADFAQNLQNQVSALNVEFVFEEAVSLEKKGELFTVNLLIKPTYLYVLSEPDLDNPTVKIEN